MPRTNSLVDQLQRDFADITFVTGDDFVWSPRERTITYRPLLEEVDTSSVLHELAHANLGHTTFTSDIELIGKEAEAWQHAIDTLAPRYSHLISIDYVDEQLDSYRDWLHNRSRCPTCRQTGIQNATQASQYNCLNCSAEWRVNDARRCALRRYSLTKS
ncbi:MAG TPA: hypothetical protein VH144_00790 [Candidatus Saccharimonadales bacterium]|jgi:hypothetical protein|nr:hypothetical protein [Candidatus Saccharimonadales bacterium]